MRSPARITLSACLVSALLLGAVAAPGLYEYTDAELAGPEQPIAFSHKVHATDLTIPCLYCHTAATRSQHATVPAVSICMGCHQWVRTGPSEGSAEEIAKIHDYYQRGKSIPWIRVHGVPEYVQFKHHRHVRAGVACQTCHGPVETMNRVYMTPDTKLRPHSLWLPAAKLEMGWCMDCHEKRGASKDCAACHY
ncbi:MAG: cytochrome c3 family protein [Myxococcota bacterium]